MQALFAVSVELYASLECSYYTHVYTVPMIMDLLSLSFDKWCHTTAEQGSTTCSYGI